MYSHAACHIVARRGEHVRFVGTPLQLSDRVLVSQKLGFAYTANFIRLSRSNNATIPDLCDLVYTSASDDKWSVLVPID